MSYNSYCAWNNGSECTSVDSMIKRFTAFALFCLLTIAGVPAVQSNPLCAQIMPECCCIEAPAPDTVFRLDQTVACCAENDDSAEISLQPDSTSSGHDDCCCEISDTTDNVDEIVPASPITVDLATSQTATTDSAAFPLHQHLSIGASAHMRRPLHLATNKVYLLKRSFLI